MSHVYRALTLVLLLLTAQQGAVMHELGHIVSAAQSAAVNCGSDGVSDGACALCPAFAQAASPAFSHSFHITPARPHRGRAQRRAADRGRRHGGSHTA